MFDLHPFYKIIHIIFPYMPATKKNFPSILSYSHDPVTIRSNTVFFSFLQKRANPYFSLPYIWSYRSALQSTLHLRRCPFSPCQNDRHLPGTYIMWFDCAINEIQKVLPLVEREEQIHRALRREKKVHLHYIVGENK